MSDVKVINTTKDPAIVQITGQPVKVVLGDHNIPTGRSLPVTSTEQTYTFEVDGIQSGMPKVVKKAGDPARVFTFIYCSNDVAFNVSELSGGAMKIVWSLPLQRGSNQVRFAVKQDQVLEVVSGQGGSTKLITTFQL